MQVSQAVERIDYGSKSSFLSLLQSPMKLDFSCREVYLKCCNPGTNSLPDPPMPGSVPPFTKTLKDAVRQDAVGIAVG